jgi:hypothetical protein
MNKKKNKSAGDKRTAEGARELSVSMVISTREAKQKVARGFYCRPDVLDAVANRLLQTFQLFTDTAAIKEDNSPHNSSPSSSPAKKSS